jgi:hypothetical protein
VDYAGSKGKIQNRLYISKLQILKQSKKMQKLPRGRHSDYNIIVMDTKLRLKTKENNQGAKGICV